MHLYVFILKPDLIKEYNRMVQKEYEAGKMIHREMCKRSKYVHVDNFFMYKPDAQNPLGLWDTNGSLIPVTRPEL